MRTFVYPNKDDKTRLVVACLADETMDPLETISPDGFFLDDSCLPPDASYWFDCLTITGPNKIHVDMDKARELTRKRLRMERIPLLEELDVQFQRALEANPSSIPTDIVKKKQALRDITRLVSSCSSPGELKALCC
jgi:hypothetical protein